MTALAIAELVSAAYVFFLGLNQLLGHNRSVSMKRVQMLTALTFVWLLSDVFWNVRDEAIFPDSLIYVVNLLSYTMSNVVLMVFLYYCDAFIGQKTKLNKWIFRIPIIITASNILVVVYWYLTDRIVRLTETGFEVIGTVPLHSLVEYLVFLFYAPVVAFIKRKEVGRLPVLLLAFLGLPVIAAIIILINTGIDVSVLAGSVSTVVIATLLQSELTQSQIEAAAASRALVENNARMLALEDNFESLYDVELETGNYELYVKGKKFSEQIIPKLIKKDDFFSDILINVSQIVFPPDRDGVIRVLTREYIRKSLDEADHFDWLYRLSVDGDSIWYRMRIVYKSAEKRNVIIGIFNAEEEIAVKRSADHLRDELISRMVNDDGLFLIDCREDVRKTLHDHSSMSSNYNDSEKYSVSVKRYIDTLVSPQDREMMHRVTAPDYMLDRLKTNNEYIIEYRDISSGVQRFYQMRVAKFSDTEVLQSFIEKDKEIVERLVFEKLKDDYFAFICVDLDSGYSEILKNTVHAIPGEEGTVSPYVSSMKNLSNLFDGETKAFFEKISDISYLKQRFATESKATYTYRSHMNNGTAWGILTELVLSRHEDGTPSLFALGFGLLDTNATQQADLQRHISEDMQTIGGLAEEYSALFYIDMDKGSFKTYSFDSALLNSSRGYLYSADSWTDILRKYGQSDLIHPDDRHLFLDIDENAIRNQLSRTKKYSTRYRRRLGEEYLWFEMDIVKYEGIDERANSIAIGFANRDSAIRSEQAISSCYSILNNELPAKEAIDKLLSIAGEFYGAERCYIFEFDEAGETFSNTFEWCAEGIEPMITRLQNIPIREVDGWINEFKRNGAFFMDTLGDGHTTPEGLEILAMQGIDSLIAAPITNGDRIVGFIGVDNPSKGDKNITVLKNGAIATYSEILMGKQAEAAVFKSAKTFADAFLESYISAYYVNLIDYSQIVFNRSEYIENNYGDIDNYLVSVNKYIDECVYPDDKEAMYEAVQPRYIKDRLKSDKSFSVNMRDISDGSIRWFRFDVTRGSDEDHVGLAFTDITEQIKRIEKQQQKLEDALSMAESASRAKTTFLNSMSHDIRTPMNAIIGFTGLAAKHIDDKEKVQDYLGKIGQSSDHLLSLINDVLDMSRIESGKMTLNEKPENITELVQTLGNIVQADMDSKEHHFTLNTDGIKNENVVCDRLRLNQVLLNILSNSIKYTDRGGEISMRVTEKLAGSRGYATYEFCITDNGMGMDEEFIKNIFVPFTRAKSSTVSGIQGTGLGMTISKSIIDMMGGHIDIQSTPGKGTSTTIEFTFKLQSRRIRKVSGEVVEVPEAEPAAEAPVYNFAGRRILLVEDNELNREIATAILVESGFEIDHADDGDVAVEKIKAAKPGDYDLILMDIQMPRMDGYEATRQIRALSGKLSKIPIIAMTANAFEEDQRTALEAGMNEHIAKPIDVPTLMSTLAKFL